MIVNIDSINEKVDSHKRIGYWKKKRTNYLGCIFIFLLPLLIIAILGYYYRSYIYATYIFLSFTNKSVSTKLTNNQSYKYSGNNIETILLLGSDNDAKFDPNNVLTQTDILIILNNTTKKIYLVSMPRDFWIPVNGVSGGYAKLDEVSGYGGFGLTISTIESDFNIKIDNYAWVGLTGFVKVIDTFGGINIDVNHPVVDYNYPNDISGSNPYSSIRLYIPAGLQHLDGITALEYVRSRHGDLLGDFGRSARQQQVLLTLEKKIQDFNLISKIPEIANDLNGYVRTDMTVQEITGLLPVLANIKQYSIEKVILSPPTYSSDGVSPNGQQDVVYPNMQAINSIFSQIYGSN